MIVITAFSNSVIKSGNIVIIFKQYSSYILNGGVTGVQASPKVLTLDA